MAVHRSRKRPQPDGEPTAAARDEQADLLASVASQLTVVDELPKTTRGGESSNPFIEQVRVSFNENKPLSTPPLPDEDVADVVYRSIRRAAQVLGYGVSLRKTPGEDGIVVTFQAREKQSRSKG